MKRINATTAILAVVICVSVEKHTMRIARLLAIVCLAAASVVAGEPAPQDARPPVPQLPVYAEDAIPPGLREEIVRETPGRLGALRERMDAQWARVKTEIGEDRN